MMYNSNKKINSNRKISFFRILILSFSFIILGFLTNLFINNFSSNKISSSSINDFYRQFNNCEFDEAKKSLETTYSSGNIDDNELLKDLNEYFTRVISKVCSSMNSGDITDNEALLVFNEIRKYDILNSSLDKLIASIETTNQNSSSTEIQVTNNTYDSTEVNSSKNTKSISSDNDSNISKDNSSNTKASNSNNNLSLAIEALNNQKYSESMSYLSSIKETDSEYKKAQDYILECKNEYKKYLFSEADKLSAKDYYTKAIEFLNAFDKSILDTKDKDIIEKISSIEKSREDYLNNLDKE